MSAMDDTERKNKNNAAYGGTVDDLQRVVRARKYRFCAAEYSQLAEGATNMPEVRNRYSRSHNIIASSPTPKARVSRTTKPPKTQRAGRRRINSADARRRARSGRV